MAKRRKSRGKSFKALLVMILIFGATILCTYPRPTYFHPHTTAEYASSVVMVLGREAGGTGLIFSSNEGGSQILTNNHICEDIKRGGYLEQNGLRYRISGYKQSTQHDLCFIKTPYNFHSNIKLAPEAPEAFSEGYIAGHPHLMPTIVTHGHFSENYRVAVELENGKVLYYESQVVSATIMVGSSGSPVFDDKSELAGVVFAGEDELSYAIIVPHRFVKAFVEQEAPRLPWKKIGEKTHKTKTSKEIRIKRIFLITKPLGTPHRTGELLVPRSGWSHIPASNEVPKKHNPK